MGRHIYFEITVCGNSSVSSITIASFLLPAILTRTSASFPEFRSSVRVESAVGAMHILRRGEADIAFWEGIQPSNTFHTLALGSYQLCAACSPDFPLIWQGEPQAVAAPCISPEQLCACPLLLREQGSAIRDTLDHFLALASQKAAPVWESVNSFALIKAAEAGLGITILPENLLHDSLLSGKLRLIRIQGMKMKNKMFAVFQKEKYITKPMRKLLECLKNYSSCPDII